MMTSNTFGTKSGGNVCLDIEGYLMIYQAEGEDDAEGTLKELLDLANRRERRS